MPGSHAEVDSRWATELLDKTRHERSAFAYGTPALDRYLQKQAAQEMHRLVSATHVLVDADQSTRIRDHHTLSSTAVELDALPDETARKLPSQPRVSVVLIPRLAVNGADAGRGCSALLVADALRRACAHAHTIGAALIVVQAKDDNAVRFYQHFGFRTFPDHCYYLFMPMRETFQL